MSVNFISECTDENTSEKNVHEANLEGAVNNDSRPAA